MKKYFLIAKDYVVAHKKQFITGGAITLGALLIILGIALFAYNTSPTKIVYEPAKACDLLTLDEAKELLGDLTINGVSTDPALNGSTTTSKCSYSDGKSDTANAVVAAIVVRSGINDGGIALNKAQFASGKPTTEVQSVSGIGDDAYFNEKNGQLNVLKESTWIILSYGAGADPASNKLEDVVKLANKVLN